MKNIQFIILFCFLVFSTNAQKVDIDNFRINVDYASMPKHKTDVDKRTYSLEVSGKYKFDKQEIANSLNLRGWQWQEEGGDVQVHLKLSDFVRGQSSQSKDRVENKDKAGKVISTTTYYRYTSKNTGRASLYINGPKNPYVKKGKEKKDKKPSRSDLKKAEEAKKKADNPFLQGVEDIETDDVADSPDRVAYYDLSQSYKVEGSKSKSAREALNSYTNKANDAYSSQLENYQADVISRANYGLNETYGYNRKRDYARFKELDSRKHPENDMFENATDALKEILGKKRFNKSNLEVATALEPILVYFESIKDKYGKDEKHEKRLKAAAMYNMAQVYYYLDQPDKTIAIGNEFLRWGHEERDGEKFIEKGEELKHLLEFHQVDGRYFETNENADDIEAETFETDDDN